MYVEKCPFCGAVLQIQAEWANRQIECPVCHKTFTVPPPPSAATDVPTLSVAPPDGTGAFCRHCGAPVAPRASACLKCGCVPATGSAYCGRCGVAVKPEQVVCIACGCSLTHRNSHLKWWVLGGILSLFVILGVCTLLYFFCFRKNTASGSTTSADSAETVTTAADPAKPVGSKTITLPGGVELKLLPVKAGTFTMSRRDGENAGDEKEHEVTLSQDYWLGQTEVTQAQWKAVMETTIRDQRDKVDKDYKLYGEGANYPMYYVSWNEAMEFCEILNRLCPVKGMRFTLPTEAQWEYAALDVPKSNGHYYKYSGSHNLNAVGWYDGNSNDSTHPVGTKQANELGFYDMSGNVWEWCLDDYTDDSRNARPEFVRGNDVGGSDRVLRGGGWFSNARICRSADRFYYSPGDRGDDLGFRVALVPGQ